MFNENLRKMRQKMNITQAALAKKLDVSSSTIGMYEQGRREPDSKMLMKMSELFGVSVDYLLSSKRSVALTQSANDLADRVTDVLRDKKKFENYGSKVNNATIDVMVKAVREEIYEAFRSVR